MNYYNIYICNFTQYYLSMFRNEKKIKKIESYLDRIAAPTREGIRRFLPRSTQTAKSTQDAGPRVQAPMRFLLAPVVSALCTPIELPRLHHQGDE